MGLLALGMVLACAVSGLELYIVQTFRPEKFQPLTHPVVTRWFWQLVHMLGPWIEKSPVNGLIFSLGLSISVGIIFPAAGVTVMLAGVASTIMTQPVYAGKRWWKKHKDLGIWGSVKNLVK